MHIAGHRLRSRHLMGLTRSIPIRAGVKLGCPLSPTLFNLCIELIVRQTFPVVCDPPSTKLPRPVSSASTNNHSNAGPIMVVSADERAGSEVASPVQVVKRRHLTAKGWSCNSQLDASAMVSAALNQLRPRPTSVSDDGDLRYDPLPCASEVRLSDEDCAVDGTFDEPSCPPRSKTTLLAYPRPRQPRDASNPPAVMNAATEPALLGPTGS